MTVNELTLGMERLTRTGDKKSVTAMRVLLDGLLRDADGGG